MIMRKKLLFFVCAVFMLGAINAQDSLKAKKLLDQVSEKVKSYDNMVIKFNYILDEADSEYRRETKGDVALQGNKYKLDLMGTTRIFDGKKLYDIIPADEEINISDYDPSNDDGISPSQMLTFYEKGYDYEWDITQNVQGRTVQYIKLTPKKGSDDPIKQILLGIDPQTKHIIKLIQIQKDGTKLTIDVKSFKTDQPLSENMFKFNEDKYEGYYINRLD